MKTFGLLACLAVVGCFALGALSEQTAVAGRPGATGAAAFAVAGPVVVEAGSMATGPGIGNPAGDLSGFGGRW